MRTPILAAVVVTAAIAGAGLAMGPSNASASDDFPAADVVFMEPVLEGRNAITGPILMVTVDDPNDGAIVEVDLYGPALLWISDPAPMFTAPMKMITTGR